MKQFYLTHGYDTIKYYHPDPIGTGSDGNEGVLCIPQSSSITKVSSSDCLLSYPGYTFYSSAGIQLVYSAGSADWNRKLKRDNVLL